MYTRVFVVAALLIGSIRSGSSDFSLDGLQDMLSSLESTMEMFGIGGCMYKCPEGESLVSNPKYVHTSNGCGSFGIEVKLSDMPMLTSCCNEHDGCYSVCNGNKTLCDIQLQDCAQKSCLTMQRKESNGKLSDQVIEACESLAEMMYTTTSLLGCQPYRDAQKEACMCVKDSDSTDYREDL